MLVRIYDPSLHQWNIKQLTRRQLEEEFKTNPHLEKVDVLKISRTITRRRVLG